MKALMLIALLATIGTTNSAHAYMIDDGDFTDVCSGGYYDRDVGFCIARITFSLPTLLVAADLNEMSESDVQEFIRAEAQNYVDGVEGEYLLLKKTASAMNLSVDEVAHEILAGK